MPWGDHCAHHCSRHPRTRRMEMLVPTGLAYAMTRPQWPSTAQGTPMHVAVKSPCLAAPSLPCTRAQGPGPAWWDSSGGSSSFPAPPPVLMRQPLRLQPAQRQQQSMPGRGAGAPGQAPADEAHPHPAPPGGEQAAAPSRWLQPPLNQHLLNEGKALLPPPQHGGRG